MILYRYTRNGEGIFQALAEEGFSFGDETAFGWLSSPLIYEDKRLKLQAWFTEEGNAMFQNLVLPLVERFGIIPEVEVVQSMPGTPVYIDDYQVIINKGDRVYESEIGER